MAEHAQPHAPPRNFKLQLFALAELVALGTTLPFDMCASATLVLQEQLVILVGEHTHVEGLLAALRDLASKLATLKPLLA